MHFHKTSSNTNLTPHITFTYNSSPTAKSHPTTKILHGNHKAQNFKIYQTG